MAPSRPRAHRCSARLTLAAAWVIGGGVLLGCATAPGPGGLESVTPTPSSAELEGGDTGPEAELGSARSAPGADAEDPAADAEDPAGNAAAELSRRLERFWASPEDAPAQELLGVTLDRHGKHYLAGNEKGLHVYREHLLGLGGGYVGVGSDQAYLLMGWMRPEYAWLIDYDPMVVRIHDAYAAFLAAAPTPEDFVALWEKDALEEGLALLAGRYEGARLEAVGTLYRRHRVWVHRRLSGVRKRHQALGVASFLTDQADYDAVRELVAARRVRPMSANLLEQGAVAGIGAAARDMGVPVRLLYLSNAEEYWPKYPRAFRSNVAALPFDERSLVVRCLLTWEENGDYWYNLQPAFNYLAWLAEPWVRRVYQIARRPRLGPDQARPEWWLVITDAAPVPPEG